MGTAADRPIGVRIALNRDRQRELYGAPLGDRVRRLTVALGITQARLARTLGVSPAMLSQLVSGRRVKIGDPAVLARLLLLDQRCAGRRTVRRDAVEALLDEVAGAQLDWTARAARVSDPLGPGPEPAPGGGPGAAPPEHPAARRARPAPAPAPAEALRAVAPPARLAAAAERLAPAFPELADVLREAAGRTRTG
jgi:transcriptional regulator with XRE-family HTH domain